MDRRYQQWFTLAWQWPSDARRARPAAPLPDPLPLAVSPAATRNVAVSRRYQQWFTLAWQWPSYACGGDGHPTAHTHTCGGDPTHLESYLSRLTRAHASRPCIPHRLDHEGIGVKDTRPGTVTPPQDSRFNAPSVTRACNPDGLQCLSSILGSAEGASLPQERPRCQERRLIAERPRTGRLCGR